GGDTEPTPPPQLNAEQISKAYQNALASKDLAKFSDLLTNDFVFTQVPGAGGAEKLTVTGKSAFMVRLAGQMEDNTKLTFSDEIYDGANASGKFAITADNFTAIGVDVLSGAYEAVARDGKLASLATVVDGPSLQKLGAAFAKLAPPSTEQINKAYQDALAAKDLAKFGDLLTDDFVFTQVPGPGGAEKLTVTGKSAFMVRLAGQMEDNTKLTFSDEIYDGANGSGKFALTGDNFTAIGVDVLSGSYEAVARDGKLASLTTVVDGPSLQKLGAALAKLAAAAP
ncbi:MAG: nuclear transport factor 2 family protein, partial [Chloroflexi bacterium]|nr:nuclear transport factor 2 family protein [Chloroflexota bacterium]